MGPKKEGFAWFDGFSAAPPEAESWSQPDSAWGNFNSSLHLLNNYHVLSMILMSSKLLHKSCKLRNIITPLCK